jgi:hypothetical protein
MERCSAGAQDSASAVFVQQFRILKLGVEDVSPTCMGHHPLDTYLGRWIDVYGDSSALRVISRHHEWVGTVPECDAAPTSYPTAPAATATMIPTYTPMPTVTPTPTP